MNEWPSRLCYLLALLAMLMSLFLNGFPAVHMAIIGATFAVLGVGAKRHAP